jgi:hypothetical protein
LIDLKIAILTKSNNSSPKVLAESLKLQLNSFEIEADIFFELDVLNRLVTYRNSKLSFHFWLKRKLSNWKRDVIFLRQLKKYDAVIISECIPNAFYKSFYNIEQLKKVLLKPVFVYEVYALENAPTQVMALKKSNDTLQDRYDGHLYISPITEIRNKNIENSFCIGLLANSWNLKPVPKKELMALVDFAQPEFEEYRSVQIAALKKAAIPFIVLEKRYTLEEIRLLYSQVSIYFMQSYEAFGLPILECLCAGATIFTPHSSWPMSWRLDEMPAIHGEGILPNCFSVYDTAENLLEKLQSFKNDFNNVETPKKVFHNFLETYPSFYNGNNNAILDLKNYVIKCNN